MDISRLCVSNAFGSAGGVGVCELFAICISEYEKRSPPSQKKIVEKVFYGGEESIVYGFSIAVVNQFGCLVET